MSSQNLGGRLKHYVEFWHTITDDDFIIQCIKGVKLDFQNLSAQSKPMPPINCSISEKVKIDGEIKKYIDSGIIKEIEHCKGEYVSQIFPRPKKNGNVRIILNLRNLNEDIKYEHFKMESLDLALGLIDENFYLSKIDLSDAYYSVSIHPNFRKYLRFEWNHKLYEFVCLPNGLTSAPRIFTKIMKPIFSMLRSSGFLSVYYLDDSLLIGRSLDECNQNIQATSDLLSKAGFIINKEKSSCFPSQKIKFLGFYIDSIKMCVSLPEDKIENLIEIALKLKAEKFSTIRFVSKFVGILVSSIPAVQYGALYYRYLEKDKIEALKENKGNFESLMQLNCNSLLEIDWWLKNIHGSCKPIRIPPPNLQLTTDASSKGWGAVFQGDSTGGLWSPLEAELHINVLELKAIYLGLCSFLDETRNQHIQVYSDNTTAVCYINNLGGVKSIKCHEISKAVWEWAITRNNYISAAHLPGSENTLADEASRTFDINTEWELDFDIFIKIFHQFGPFDVDLFASRLNHKVKVYAAWKPDPNAAFIDSFTIPWHNFKFFYAFPPFSIIMRCLKKISEEKARGVIVVPVWPTQSWFPKLIRMLNNIPTILPMNVIHLPFKKDSVHKQYKNLRLMVCPVSGNSSEAEDFQNNPSIYCLLPGESPPSINMKYILGNGILSVLKRKLIPCHMMK